MITPSPINDHCFLWLMYVLRCLGRCFLKCFIQPVTKRLQNIHSWRGVPKTGLRRVTTIVAFGIWMFWAQFRRRTFHVPNLMLMTKVLCLISFALGSAHENFRHWKGRSTHLEIYMETDPRLLVPWRSWGVHLRKTELTEYYGRNAWLHAEQKN